MRSNLVAVSLAAVLASSMLFIGGCTDDDEDGSATVPGAGITPRGIPYEVWGTDQSNTVADAGGRGLQGSNMWIWDSADVETQLAGGAAAAPIPCNNGATPGPCAMEAIFPGDLVDEEGTALSDAFGAGFARMHGSLPDPRGKYMNVNMFAPGGGYVGIMDGKSKSAVALFRVSKNGGPTANRSVHMSFWNKDGSALFVANLHGRIVERIDITRDAGGNITNANLNRAAALSAASGIRATIAADGRSHAYRGNNALGVPLVSTVSGDYSASAFTDLTPAGKCKENGCTTAADGTTLAEGETNNGAAGGRPGGVIICPIVSDNDMLYITFGAGGMLVADARKTPMQIVAEYGNQEVNGAGCGGVHTGDSIWLDGGVSAAPGGANRSTFTVYTVNDTIITAAANAGTILPENTPAIKTIFKDESNTSASGNIGAVVNVAAGTVIEEGSVVNNTGQIFGTSTRRDAHGMINTTDDKYVHVVDRIQNTMEVFETATETHVGSYSLMTDDGSMPVMGESTPGACADASVTDDAALPTNDPAPDLMDTTPDGKYIVVALRGPAPVTVTHGAQGSCPGVGMIELTQGGASGKLVAVLRSVNTVDNAEVSAPGGVVYIGAERSDIHGAATRRK